MNGKHGACVFLSHAAIKPRGLAQYEDGDGHDLMKRTALVVLSKAHQEGDV
jgi:hypothetical protein